MKFHKFFVLFFSASTLFAQNINDVALTVVGSGETIEEAKTNALRSAIEQAYGVFVSSNTEILNDELVKDEVVSISSGTVKEYNILSQIELRKDLFSVTLSATVSVSGLQSYAQSKGATVEFAGGLFSTNLTNLKLQELNEKNEVAAIRHLCRTAKIMTKNAFNYSIHADQPKLYVSRYVNDERVHPTEQTWELKVNVLARTNKTFVELKAYLIKSLNGISMTQAETQSYKELNKSVVQLQIMESETVHHTYNLRHIHSLALLQDFVWFLDFGRANFSVDLGGLGSAGLLETKSVEAFGHQGGRFRSCSQHCEFIHYFDFHPKWALYLNEDSYDDYSFNPDDDFYSYTKATYDLIKSNIQNEFKCQEDNLLKQFEYAKKWGEETHELERAIYNLRSSMADSATCLVTTDENLDMFRTTCRYPMKISLTPVEHEKIGIFNVYYYLTKEQLERINYISVKVRGDLNVEIEHDIIEEEHELEEEPDIFEQEFELEQEIEEPVYVEPAAPAVEEPEEPDFFVVVEDMPEFPGGEAAMYKWLGKNIRYPQVAKENGIEGNVFVRFIVNENGKVQDAQVLRGIGGGCDEEALRVVKEMPPWKPGTARGKPVRVQFTIPIGFQLN